VRIRLRGDRDAAGLATALAALPDDVNTRAVWLRIGAETPLQGVLETLEVLLAGGFGDVVFGPPDPERDPGGLWLNGRLVEPRDDRPPTGIVSDHLRYEVRPERPPRTSRK
jgi:hypothetical protein